MLLASWEEVAAHLRASMQLARDEPDWIGLFMKFGETPSELQRIKIQHIQAFKKPWVLLLAEICREARLPPREALLHNMKPAIGAIALDGEHFVYRCVLPLAVDSGALDLAVELVAREAMLLRTRSKGDLPPPVMWEGFDE